MSAPIDISELASDAGVARLTHYNGTVTLLYNEKLHSYYVEDEDGKVLVPGATTVVGMIDKSAALTGWAARSTIEAVQAAMDAAYRVDWLDDGYAISKADLAELLLEAKKNYRNLTTTAADIGHLAHDWLENNSICMIAGRENDQPLPDNPKACNSIDAALKWQGRHNFHPVKAERKVYSKRLGVAGTFDWTAYIDSCDDRMCCPYEFKDMYALGDYKSSRAIYDEYRIQTAFYKEAVEEEFPDEKIDIRVILHIDKHEGEFDTMLLIKDEDFQADITAFEGALAIWNWMTTIKLDKRFEKEKIKAAAALLKPKKAPRKSRIKKVEDEDFPVVAA